MSRQHKILIGVFCLGVLLCGIGTGVAFTEFSGFEYGGKYILGETDMQTEDFDVTFVPAEDRWTLIGAGGAYVAGMGEIQTDRSIPENTVRFHVTYNAKRAKPFVYLDEQTNRIEFSWYWRNNNDETALMMEAKDILLKNLKEGKIASFDTVELEEVAVMVNPKNEDDVRVVY